MTHILEVDYSDYKNEFEFKKNILFQKYNIFCEVHNKKDLINDLISQIGTVDSVIEGYKNSEKQRDLSIKFHWGHNHRFNDEIFVPGRMGDRHIHLMAEFMAGYKISYEGFANKKILDVGCWTGGTTLLLKALEANRIIAIEEVKKYAKAANMLFSSIYNLEKVKCLEISLFHLDMQNEFDIVYCPGVIYHLSDPILGLRIMFNALQDGGIILLESAGINSAEPICQFEGNYRYHNSEGESLENLNRGGWNWFLPSPECLGLWMLDAGFEDISCYFSPVSGRVYGFGRRVKFKEITRAGLSRPDII